MPVSGLVVSLRDDPQLRRETLTMIGNERRITMGALEANRLAVVLDTASGDEDGQVWDWLRTLPGVTLVDVAFIGFEPDDSSGPERVPSRKDIGPPARSISGDVSRDAS